MSDRISKSPRQRGVEHKDNHNAQKSSNDRPNEKGDTHSSSREQTVIRSVQRTDLGRIADLVSCGDLPFPGNLPTSQLSQLAAMVRERRRRRLIRFIARSIALSIRDEIEPCREGKTNVEKPV